MANPAVAFVRPRRELLRVVSRAGKIFYCILLAALFWSAASRRFHFPGWPFAGRDAWGYFHPAISRFAGGPFVHTNARNFVYPGFLFLVLWTTNSVRAITVVQHLLGLGTGALLLACWKKLRRFVRAMPRALHALLGLCLAAIYLLSSRPIQYEHDLRPESITPFFAILNILLTLIFFEQRFGKEPSNRAAITGALLLVNSVLLAFLKTSFVFTVFFSIIPVLVALADHRESWSRRLAILGPGLIAFVAVLTTESRLAKSDPAAGAFLPESLFSIHANLIVQQMDADVAQQDCGEYSCDLLGTIAASLHQDMAASWPISQTYKSFGFDPDYLLYERSSMPSWRDRFFEGDREKLLRFCSHYYWRTVRHHPGAMLHKIATQLVLFYRAPNRSFSLRSTVHARLLYEGSSAVFAGRGENEPERELMAEYGAACTRLSQSDAAVSSPLLVRFANWLLSFAYWPVLLCVLLFAGAAAIGRRLRTNYGTFAVVVLFLFSYNFGNSLGTAIVHSLHILRYNETQYAFSLLAVLAGILFLSELAWQLGERLVRRS